MSNHHYSYSVRPQQNNQTATLPTIRPQSEYEAKIRYSPNLNLCFHFRFSYSRPILAVLNIESLPLVQFTPVYPGAHTHTPSAQRPLPPQRGSSQTPDGRSHSGPLHPTKHSHRPLRYVPRPLHRTGQAPTNAQHFI